MKYVCLDYIEGKYAVLGIFFVFAFPVRSSAVRPAVSA